MRILKSKSIMKTKYLKLTCLSAYFAVVLIFLKFYCLASEKPVQQIENYEPVIEMVIQEEEIIESELDRAVRLSSEKYSIPKEVIYAVIATESNLHGTNEINKENIFDVNSRAKSSCDCVGLMQISKYALDDYNRFNNTNYILEELYDISLNIEVGTWYFSQFNKVASTWAEQYVIYNVGYGEFCKVNEYSFYDYDGELHSQYSNNYFYLNNVLPPTEGRKSLCGNNKLPSYGAKKRFETCLKVCNEIS